MPQSLPRQWLEKTSLLSKDLTSRNSSKVKTRNEQEAHEEYDELEIDPDPFEDQTLGQFGSRPSRSVSE
jgi:hypothetical protein